MSKQSFLPRLLDQRRAWLSQFVTVLQDPARGLAAKYHVPAATLTRLDHGRLWFEWAFASLPAARGAAAAILGFRDNLISGGGPLLPPTPPTYAPPPSVGGTPLPVEAGILALASSVGAQIKAAHHYDPADGRLLGLEGAKETLPDPATTAPDLRRSFITSGGHVEIDWPKGPFDGVKIEVDRGDGRGFTYLATDTAPNYLDTVKPAPGTAALYRYRAIYLLDDAPYGQWSPTVEITLKG